MFGVMFGVRFRVRLKLTLTKFTSGVYIHYTDENNVYAQKQMYFGYILIDKRQ